MLFIFFMAVYGMVTSAYGPGDWIILSLLYAVLAD